MNKTFIIILTLVIAGLVYLLAPILTPFLVGALLAYLMNPLVIQLMRLRLPRILAVVIVFLIFFLIISLLMLLFIPLIQTQIDRLVDVVPNIVAWIQTILVPRLKEYIGTQQVIDVNSLKTQLSQNWTKAGGAATWIFATILHSGFTMLHWFINLVLIFVVMFYLLYDWQKLVDGVRNLLPRSSEPTIVKLVGQCNEVLGAFFRGQLLVMVTLGIFYAVGLSLIGLQIGLMIGIIIGILTIVPYLGIIVGIIIASVAAAVQFDTYTPILLVWLLFAVGQALDGMLITPKLVGDRIGLHPVAVIFAVLAGGALFGFFGVLLALPVAAVSMVLLRFLNERYHSSKLYNSRT
jgi:predicted PurR-regulated permease PerM